MRRGVDEATEEDGAAEVLPGTPRTGLLMPAADEEDDDDEAEACALLPTTPGLAMRPAAETALPSATRIGVDTAPAGGFLPCRPGLAASIATRGTAAACVTPAAECVTPAAGFLPTSVAGVDVAGCGRGDPATATAGCSLGETAASPAVVGGSGVADVSVGVMCACACACAGA